MAENLSAKKIKLKVMHSPCEPYFELGGRGQGTGVQARTLVWYIRHVFWGEGPSLTDRSPLEKQGRRFVSDSRYCGQGGQFLSTVCVNRCVNAWTINTKSYMRISL